MNALSTFPTSINVVVFDGKALVEDTVAVKVEYWSRPPSCSKCNYFGHSLLKCPKTNFQWVPKTSPCSPEAISPIVSKASPYLIPPDPEGSWTAISKRPKNPTPPVVPRLIY